MQQTIDLSRLTRRKVDMNTLPDHSKTLQQRVHEEAVKRLKAQQGHGYRGLCLRSEADVDSYERSFEDRVCKIVNDSLRWNGEFYLPEE